ncbi:MAG: LysM peptidoglycan-binding domain-containing protein [Planctomycetota bacterium]|nr:LysM peptidoglycan-binding domain-containing protein [Planctomycetota bacterium]
MGNFEKLVVLGVLFLSAIVLAVSLTGDSDSVEVSGPLGAAEKATQGSGAEGVPAAQAEEQIGRGETRPLLTTEVRPKDGVESATTPGTDAKRQSIPRTSEDGRALVLRTRKGLERSPIEDFMLYTAVKGDTWAGLADRFYKNRKHVPLLRGANEDVVALQGGETILVPVYDFRAESGRAPAEAAPAREEAQKVAPGGVYVVKAGDNLSAVSKKVYGTATRWTEIFNANRDVLDSPDWLDVGMRLRIP